MSEKAERLVNLTVALLEARRPMTLTEIRAKLPGYGQDDPETARRMFERDKEDLRRLGIPVRTVATDAFESEWGYVVDREEYELPPLRLDAEQVAALALALELTGEESARLGLAKVAALAPDPRPAPVPPAQIDLGLAAEGEVADALVERRIVAFGYRDADGVESVRTLDPYGLVQRRGNWYLVGRDHSRDDIRAFRLDRIVSGPRAEGPPGAFTPPEHVDLAAHVRGPAAAEAMNAEVAFAPAAAGEAERGGGTVVRTRRDGWVVARFEAVDPERFLPRILVLGEEAEILRPRRLREEAAGRLRRLAGEAT
ncbi:MAG: helix-turn-helix transcriptional regulator [Nitriliruptorales bacterium]